MRRIYKKGDTIRRFFRTNASGGGPIALTSGEVRAFEDGATTAISAGITLTASHGGVGGRNLVTVDTSNAAYTDGHDYDLILTAGTADGVSIVAIPILSFSLGIAEADITKVNHVAIQGDGSSGNKWRPA